MISRKWVRLCQGGIAGPRRGRKATRGVQATWPAGADIGCKLMLQTVVVETVDDFFF